ncbi:TPA: O-antigen ligase family protein [Klebsiella pneumoniae]
MNTLQEHYSTTNKRLKNSSDWLIKNILPLGWMALLTGMFWVGDRSYYHKIYYLLLAAPALIAVTLQPRQLKPLLHSRLLITIVLFSIYTLITISWSSTETSLDSLAKRPLYVIILLISAGLLALAAADRFMLCLKISAYTSTIAALITLAIFFNEETTGRLDGYGALYNPLLTSHVFGAFMALWIAYWFISETPFDLAAIISITILGALIIATGSRTPLVALAACSGWLMLLTWKKRGLLVLALGVLALGLILLIFPEVITSRGMSYRPEIWYKTLLQIREAPWFGHGYDAPLAIWVSGIDYAFADPHNMLLAILYYCGSAGLLIWLAMYAIALTSAWNHRKDPLSIIASTLLIFGFAATLTEGGAFLSRPKEHWFLIWIPMAMIYAAGLKKYWEKHQ